ncbi:hypothetical protein HDV05_002634, partial [Chytridiales sp. JEL 0842]
MRSSSKPWDISTIIKRYSGRVEQLFDLFAGPSISPPEFKSSGCLFLSADVTSLQEKSRDLLKLTEDRLAITYTHYRVVEQGDIEQGNVKEGGVEEGDVVATLKELSLPVSQSGINLEDHQDLLRSFNDSFRHVLVRGGHRHPVRLLKVAYSIEHSSVFIVAGGYTPFNIFPKGEAQKTRPKSRMLPAQCVRANTLETTIRPGHYGPIDTGNKFDVLRVFGGNMDSGQSILDTAVLGLQFASETVRAVGEDEKMLPFAPVVRGTVSSDSNAFRALSGRVGVAQVALKVTEEVVAVFLMLEKVLTRAYQQCIVDHKVEKATFSHLMDGDVT